jgi:murein hydrolase activator
MPLARSPRLAARSRELLVVGMLGIAMLLSDPSVVPAQGTDRIRQQREELDRVRRERDSLEARMRELQGRAHDLSEEVQNIHRQADATARLVRQLDDQLGAITSEVDSSNARLANAENELAHRKTSLQRRIVDIYKRGPLYSTEALLSAASFGQLIARYKYLHELVLHDRTQVVRVTTLYEQVGRERQNLVRLQGEFERSRQERAEEEQRLRGLEEQRGVSLAQVKRSTKQIEERLERIKRDEARLTNVIASLEDARKKAEARPNAPAPTTSTLRTSDFGKLDWPVDGGILYGFGRLVNPNNTTIRWNGVGIEAPAGAPVRAVQAGEVRLAEPIGTYGMTVIVEHGGGDYSVYGSLSRMTVTKGAKVAKGDIIGYVGVSDPEYPAHLHFEMRPKGRAMDPLAWLKSQGTR